MKKLIDQIIEYNEGKEYTTLLLDSTSYRQFCKELSPQNSADTVFKLESYKEFKVETMPLSTGIFNILLTK